MQAVRDDDFVIDRRRLPGQFVGGHADVAPTGTSRSWWTSTSVSSRKRTMATRQGLREDRRTSIMVPVFRSCRQASKNETASPGFGTVTGSGNLLKTPSISLLSRQPITQHVFHKTAHLHALFVEL